MVTGNQDDYPMYTDYHTFGIALKKQARSTAD